MSTILTNGLKLPDKGSVDWYADMQNNYTILDNSVGTIAEHTSALAGKAPAVHTHVKADITDFPVYGTTAGTICEGNDSRLSDARTPVAHTHTKSDVTDLFNSANTWTETNTYFKQVAIGNVTSYTDCALGFTGLYNTLFFNTRGSSNINSYGTYVYYGYSNASSDRGGIIRMVRTTDKRGDTNDGYIPDLSFNLYKISTAKLFIDFMEAVRVTNDGTENSLKPITDNTTDLGTSTNQWKSVYAQNYFYNGVAWGLDKGNTWTNFNRFNGYRLQIKHTSQEIGVIPSSNQWNGFYFVDKNENPTLTFEHAFMGSGETRFKISMFDNYASYESNSAVWIEFLRLVTHQGESSFGIGTNVRPLSNNLNLGTSTNKWKTFNGINPGALSIFNPSATHDPIDVPNTWVTDGSAWNTLNVSNMGDGWICLTYKRCGTNDYILVRFGSSSASYPSMIFPATMLQDSGHYLYLLVPVAKAMGNIYLEIKLDSNADLVAHYFIPSYGTV